MAIKVSFKAGEKDLVRREISRYNAKIKRMAKMPKFAGVVLPEPLPVRETINTLQNRRELNRLLRQTERLFQKGATRIIENKAGVKTIAFVRDQARLDQEAVNRRSSKERERISKILATQAGVPTGLSRGQMVDSRMEDLKPRKFKFQSFRTPEKLKQRVQNLQQQTTEEYRQKRLELYKENYIKGVQNALGALGAEIVEVVEKLPASTVYEAYLTDEDLSITFLYDEYEMVARAGLILEIWERIGKG